MHILYSKIYDILQGCLGDMIRSGVISEPCLWWLGSVYIHQTLI